MLRYFALLIPGVNKTQLLCLTYKGTLEFRKISLIAFRCLHIYINNLTRLNIARIPIAIPTIPLINKSFFKDELIAREDNKVVP